jgi:hypothetical protein
VKGFEIILIMLVGGVVGLAVGMWLGDRRSSWLDFGTPVLFSGVVGLIVGLVAGAVIGVVVLT